LGSLFRVLSCIVVLSTSSCAWDDADTPSEVRLGVSRSDALESLTVEQNAHGHVELTRHALSYPFTTVEPPIPGGIAGGEKAFFVGSPLEGRVIVFSRASGQPIAELPQPPGHLILPLILHAIGPNRIAVLDCGGFPAPGTTDVTPSIYEYEYSFSGGSFSAELVRTVSFAGTRIGFAEEFVYLGAGRYLVPDSVYGAIWRVASDGSILPGIVPESYEPEDAIPEMVYCPTMPVVTVGGLPFLFTGATIPGVAGIAERNGTVYFYSSCAAALYKFPLAVLADRRRPWERADSIERIAGKPSHVEVEELLDMQFNPFDTSDSHLYAADALQLQLIRIDTRTGEREVLGKDPYLYNFPSSLAFLPPLSRLKPAPLLVLSNQQHRDPLLNSEVPADLTQPPYVITAVQLR